MTETLKEVRTKKNFGYPWGTISMPQGHEAYEFYASCEDNQHFSHPLCHPGWESRVAEVGGRVLFGPILTDAGWYALVAVPAGTDVPSAYGRPVEHPVEEAPAVRVDLFYPRGGWTTVRLYASAREAEEWAVRALQPNGPALAYRVRRLNRRVERMLAEGLFKPLEPGVWAYYLST
jgi:hypothetical protein